MAALCARRFVLVSSAYWAVSGSDADKEPPAPGVEDTAFFLVADPNARAAASSASLSGTLARHHCTASTISVTVGLPHPAALSPRLLRRWKRCCAPHHTPTPNRYRRIDPYIQLDV
ncbi:hypothetical protein BV25DRAFT_1818404, partial [Artomyces pyxidatus]